jgi:HSP20 family protein
VEIYAFAPGLDASKIDVTLDRGVLRISGERRSAIPDADGKVHVYTRERGTGSFTRAISLPDDVDPGRVNASYRDGVLQVSVARRESAQPKRITVQ